MTNSLKLSPLQQQILARKGEIKCRPDSEILIPGPTLLDIQLSKEERIAIFQSVLDAMARDDTSQNIARGVVNAVEDFLKEKVEKIHMKITD